MGSPNRNLVSVIISIFNEFENIEFVASGLTTLFRNRDFMYEIIFIDDGSTDDTEEVLVRLIRNDKNIRRFKNRHRVGKSYSILQGIEHSRGDIIIIMDGDGQIDTKDISNIIDRLRLANIDIVIGSKYHPNSHNKLSIFRKQMGYIYNKLVRIMLNYQLTDVQAGIKGIKSESFQKLMPIKAIKFDLDLKLISKAIEHDMKIEEIPIKVRQRYFGKSKVNKLFTSISLFIQIFEICFEQNFGPKKIYGNYQYKALHRGNCPQKFWHVHKIDLIKELKLISDDDIVLDAGCGSGNFCFALSKFCKIMYGIDIYEDAIDFANKLKEKLKSTNTVFINSSLESLSFENEFFDTILLVDVIEHLKDVSTSIRELKRVLKHKGKLVVVTPNYKSYWTILENVMDMLNLVPKLRNYQHANKYNINTLVELLENFGLQIKKVGSIYTISPFVSFFSNVLAHRLFRKEITSKNNGMLIYCVATKLDVTGNIIVKS